jgi:YbgC/YbaW family acyl-CoA thioester hydrolase
MTLRPLPIIARFMTDEFDSIVARFPCRVHWGDCDPAGIIFYPTYFRWMDAATWAIWESVGYTAKRMKAEHLAMPLVAAECRFIAPAEQGDHCEVRSRITRFGGNRSSWRMMCCGRTAWRSPRGAKRASGDGSPAGPARRSKARRSPTR